MPFADVNGQHVYYEESGAAGPPVIFSHGFLMDHEMFAPQVGDLGGDFRCITWDERGFGGTQATGPFSYWDSADDCLALLDHLGIERAVLAGMSQGGFISLRAALRAPDRVAGLILIDTQAGVEDEAARPLYEGMHDQWVSAGPDDALAGTIASLIIGPGHEHESWIAKWQATPKEALTLPFRALMDRDDITGRIGEITAPALVVHGEDDAAIPMSKAEELQSGLGNCVGLVRVPGAGHASNMARPDVVNPAVRDFLATYAGTI